MRKNQQEKKLTDKLVNAFDINQLLNLCTGIDCWFDRFHLDHHFSS